MYTLRYTIGVNWDVYVPWTDKGFIRFVDVAKNIAERNYIYIIILLT